MSDCCHCGKKRPRSEAELKKLCNRLSRIEGQVRGLREMLEKDVYCTDILVQVSAVSAALNSFSRELLGNTSAPAWRTASAGGMSRWLTSCWPR